ncbi:hypothetical protein EYR41_009128 [Orbilia oligospora]|uniref:Uncharacterized protein n=1 Tax=Orbilia oligospora TaxID=2813651 RepID=A0A8H2HN78_ORBOL|nr:hypothetical protein EYR41_009128 [Orbilia oligospora]
MPLILAMDLEEAMCPKHTQFNARSERPQTWQRLCLILVTLGTFFPILPNIAGWCTDNNPPLVDQKVFSCMADIKEREPEVASKPSKPESPEMGLKSLLPRIFCAAVAVIGTILLVRVWWRMTGGN